MKWAVAKVKAELYKVVPSKYHHLYGTHGHSDTWGYLKQATSFLFLESGKSCSSHHDEEENIVSIFGDQ